MSITIRDAKDTASKKMTLNDISVGQTFRGTITGEWGPRTGIWLKLTGPCILDTGHPVSLLVTRLTPCLKPWQNNVAHNVWSHCAEVTDYEPVEIEVIVK